MTRRRRDSCLSPKMKKNEGRIKGCHRMRKIKICDVIDHAFEMTGDAGRDISGVVYDSRMVKGGELFVAVQGEKFDGRDFIEDAIQKGAVAVMCEVDEKGPLPADRCMELERKYPEVAWIRVADVRDALALVADRFYGRPSGELIIVGITGTNGKTTTSYLVKSILERWGKETGLIGTINYLIKDMTYEAPHTTPEAPDFQCLLREMRECACG